MRRIRLGIFWRMTIINALIVGIVVWLAGVSVKDFACYLVNNNTYTGAAQAAMFKHSLQQFLIRASVAAFCIAALVHYLLSFQAFRPIRRLAAAARQMTLGNYPQPIPVTSSDDIGRLTVDFNRLIDAMRYNQESKKQMLADISHDLRTPLSNLTGYLEALRSGVIQGDAELFQSLHEEALHLGVLIEQFHRLNVWDAKQDLSGYDIQTLELQAFWDMMKQSFEMESRQANIRMELDIEHADILVNEKGLKQVADNLLQNAFRYNTGEWIYIVGKSRGSEYVVEVSNQGEALPEGKLPLLFERFYRADESRHRINGSGLGLAIVKEIVSRMGGRTGVRYDDSVFTFWFTLPIDHPKQ